MNNEQVSGRYGFDWKFLLVIAFIGFAFLKNTGCATNTTAQIKDTNKHVYAGTQPRQQEGEKLPLSLSVKETGHNPDGSISAVIHVSGGKEPYAFFAKGEPQADLRISDARTARLITPAGRDTAGVIQVYVLDGGGDIRSVAYRPE